MAWIDVISPAEATGELKLEYDKAIERAGGVANIVSIMSQNPAIMKSSMQMYITMMFMPSPLSRRQREMIATVVSVENQCVY